MGLGPVYTVVTVTYIAGAITNTVPGAVPLAMATVVVIGPEIEPTSA